MKLLNLSSSPHLHHPDSTTGVMLDVIIALIPATICGIYLFGFHAALIVAVCVASAVIAEYLWCLILKKPQPVKDLSAVLTGLILSLNLPGTLPLWMAALGSVIAIIIVKQMFGGLGQNFANPALTARIVLMVSFPSYMTRFCYPFTDTVSAATPLAGGSVPNQTLFLGNYAGCIGETSTLCLLMGGLYLVCRRVISPATPLAYFATAAAPYIPSPISIELRYTSIILCLDQNISMRNVKYISKPLRTQLRPGNKKTFLAVCWEIVEAP